MKHILFLLALLAAVSPANAQFYGQQSGPYGQRIAPAYRQDRGPYAPQDPRSGGQNSQTIMQDGQGGSCVVPPGASSCFPVR